jgi:hypothetical protein
MDDELPVVTLTVEYRYTFPLEGPYRNFDLPAELLSDLGEWQGFFDTHFDPHAGWDSVQARASWAGRDLESSCDALSGSGLRSRLTCGHSASDRSPATKCQSGPR